MDRRAFYIKSYLIPKMQHAVYISVDISSPTFRWRGKLLIIQDNWQTRYSSHCILEICPSNHVEAGVEFMVAIEYITLSSDLMYFLSGRVFIRFELNDKDHSLLLCDPDHDLHYSDSSNQVLENSKYYTESPFKEHVNKSTDIKDAFLMSYLNIKSINSLRPSDAYMRRQTNHHWFR